MSQPRVHLIASLVWALGAVTIVNTWPMPPPPGPLRISIASAGNKEEWVHQAVAEFNAASRRTPSLQLDGRPIVVEIIREVLGGGRESEVYRSGTLVDDVLSGKITPTVVSPGDQSWIAQLRERWAARNSSDIAAEMGPTLVRGPLVIVAWQSRARALGCWPEPEAACTWERIRALASSPDGWGTLGHPEWGSFKFGYAYVGEANSGTLAAVAMCAIGAGKPQGLTPRDVDVGSGCAQFMAGIERAKVHSGQRSDWLLEQMTSGGPSYLDAIAAYEADVITTNTTRGGELPEPLAAIYPQDGIVFLDQPFTILTGAPWMTNQQLMAARIFQGYLMSDDVQGWVLAGGHRPGNPNVPLTWPIDPALGANPRAKLVTLEVPDGRTTQRITETWRRIKKHAVVAVVFDKSISMRGEKIEAARQGALEFVRVMGADDLLVWRPFDGTAYPPQPDPPRPLSQTRTILQAQIRDTPAGGGNALYDAVLAAYEQLEGIRREREGALRYGIVVLSDAKDTDSRVSLVDLERRLLAEGSSPTGIQVHTIAVGPDADEDGLWKIANAGHGRFWKGQTAAEMIEVYRSIATYY